MIQDDSDWSCFISLCRKSRFLKIKKCGIFTLWAHYFVPNLQDRLILFHEPQQLVGNVAAKLKLVLRPRVYTQSVCNFPQWGCYLLHVMLLNIVSLYISTTVRMCHPSSGGYGVFHSGLRLFVVQGIQKEAVVSAVTQFIVARKVRNVRRKAWPKIPNTTAFFQLLQANADSSSSTLPYSHGGVSCPRTRWVCVCVWAGVAWSLFIPSSQLTHEVMVVTLSVGSAALIPFVLARSFTDASGVLMMESDGMRPCVWAEPLFMPSSDGLWAR